MQDLAPGCSQVPNELRLGWVGGKEGKAQAHYLTSYFSAGILRTCGWQGVGDNPSKSQYDKKSLLPDFRLCLQSEIKAVSTGYQ